MDLKDRLQRAIKKESGLRLSIMEVRAVAKALGCMSFPSKKREGRSVSVTRETRERLDVHIRWMIRRDMQDVLDIETASFEPPWDEQDFIRCLRQRNCIGMVAESNDERIAGFMLYELHKSRLRVLNAAVNPADRFKGVGVALCEKLKSKLSNQRRNKIEIDIPETNLDALMFLKSQGFVSSKSKKTASKDGSEAIRMVYKHKETERELI